jgi:hypothetical protein
MKILPHPSVSQYLCIADLCEAHRQVLQAEHLHCDIQIYVFGFHVERYTMSTENLVWSICRMVEIISIHNGKRAKDEVRQELLK